MVDAETAIDATGKDMIWSSALIHHDSMALRGHRSAICSLETSDERSVFDTKLYGRWKERRRSCDVENCTSCIRLVIAHVIPCGYCGLLVAFRRMFGFSTHVYAMLSKRRGVRCLLVRVQ